MTGTAVCVVLMTVLYIMLLVGLRKFTKNAETANQQGRKKAKEASDQLKITQALTAAITGFTLFYMLPTIVCQLAIRLDFINESTVAVLTAVSEMPMQVSGILNFFIYAQRIRDVRSSVLHWCIWTVG